MKMRRTTAQAGRGWRAALILLATTALASLLAGYQWAR